MVCLGPLGQKGNLEKLATLGNRVLLALQEGKDHVSVSVSICICTEAGITFSHLGGRDHVRAFVTAVSSGRRGSFKQICPLITYVRKNFVSCIRISFLLALIELNSFLRKLMMPTSFV